VPDHARKQEEIDTMHQHGLHFGGDWHTHPEPKPAPSASDTLGIRQAVRKSKHHLNGFVLLIVGAESFPVGLFVSLYYARGETAIDLET
jgi:integrative and conjugative element protein (TIGR02256 family)